MAFEILLVDDDLVSRDIVRHVLSDRGDAVTVADDGLSALTILDGKVFDLAILDYHMPMLDGISAARRIRAASGAGRPRFIGITADPDGLEARDEKSGLFDAIVQKPVNLEALLQVVDASLRQLRESAARDKVLEIWRSRGLDRRPRGRFAVAPAAATRAQGELFFDLGRPENPDCLLINDDASASDVARLRTCGNLFTVPAIDLGGRFGRAADAGFDPTRIGSWDEVAVQVRGFANRRRQLAGRFLNANDPVEQILAYVFVSGRDLRSLPDADAATGRHYPGLFPEAVVTAAADRLADAGLLVRLRRPASGGADPTGHFVLSDAAVELLTGAV